MKVKTIISMILIFTLIFSFISPASASENPEKNQDKVVLTEEERASIYELESQGVDADLAIKVLEVSHHVEYEADQQTLRVNLSDDELKNEYGFSESQVENFDEILEGTYQNSNADSIDESPASQVTSSPQVSTSSSGYRAGYLTYQQLTAGTFAVLGSAAAVGPAALQVAWASVSTALGGPLGAVAGISTAVLGGWFFSDLTVKILGAINQRSGVAFYLDWGVPPVSTAIE